MAVRWGADAPIPKPIKAQLKKEGHALKLLEHLYRRPQPRSQKHVGMFIGLESESEGAPAAPKACRRTCDPNKWAGTPTLAPTR
jgi:hypothetical protein